MTGHVGVRMTLDEAVGEVLNSLTGLDLHYIPELDRYRAITRMLNRALRRNSAEHEWSYYSGLLDLGRVPQGQTFLQLPSQYRARAEGDDSVRLVDEHNRPMRWAYVLPRNSLHKYNARQGLWCSVTNGKIEFSRHLNDYEASLAVQIPVMREPRNLVVPATLESIEDLDAPLPPFPPGSSVRQVRNFWFPDQIEEWIFTPGLPPYEGTAPEDALAALGMTPQSIREQTVDFQYPDLIVMLAAYLVAQTDPVQQPRVQTLEAMYTDFKFALITRDDAATDAPYVNEFQVPVQGTIHGGSYGWDTRHPHTDERR